jgi:hypothetical protein
VFGIIVKAKINGIDPQALLAELASRAASYPAREAW